MNAEKRQYLLMTAAIILFGLVAVSWFDGEHGAVAGYDFATSLNPADELKRSLYVWDERLYAGSPNALSVSAMPYFLLQYVLERAAGSLLRGQEIFFIILLTLPGLSMLYFLKTAFRDDPDRHVITAFGPLFYMFNTFVVIKWNRGELVTLFVYGILPICLGLMERILRDGFGPWRLPAVISTVFLYPVSLGHAADFLISTAVIAAFTLWRVLSVKGERMRRFKRASLVAAVAALLSAWWVLPIASSIFVLGGGGGGGGMKSAGGGGGGAVFFDSAQLDFVRYYSSWATLLNIMKMWFFSMYRTAFEFNTQFYRPGTLIFPVVAFSALLFKRNGYVLFFSALGAAGIWLSKGTSPPFPWVYEWMHRHIPFFFIFRAPSRYFPLIYALSLAPLIGVTAGRVSSLLKGAWTGRLKWASSAASSAAAAAVVLVIFLHSWPLFSRDVLFRTVSGDILHPSVFVDIPPYYRELNEWLKEKDGYFRVHSFHNQTYLNYTWGYSSTDVMPKLVEFPQTLRFRQELTLGSPGFGRLMDSVDRSVWSWEFGAIDRMLALLSVKYIAVTKDVMRRYSPGTNYIEIITAALGASPDIKPAAEFGAITIYENGKTLAHAFTAQKAGAVIGGEAALPTLAHSGYLDRRALIFADDAEKALAGLPAGSVDEIVFADVNPWDMFLDNLPAASRSRDIKDAGFRAVSTGRFIIFGKEKDAGKRASTKVSVDGAPAETGQEGVNIPVGLRWKPYGVWDAPAGSHHITVEPDDSIDELIILPLRDFEGHMERFNQILKTRDIPASEAVTLKGSAERAVMRVPFYTGSGTFGIEARWLPAWVPEKSHGFSSDFAKDSGKGWVLFDKATVMRRENGITLLQPSQSPSFKVVKKIVSDGGAPFDPEVYPYLEADWEDGPGYSHDLTLSVGIDSDGDGWADEEIQAARFSPVTGRELFDMSAKLKERYGYPGKRAYVPLWVGFEFKKSGGGGGGAGGAGGAGDVANRVTEEPQEVRIKGIRAFYEGPSLAKYGNHEKGFTAVLDGKGIIGEARKGGAYSYKAVLEEGFHELEIREEGIKGGEGPDTGEEALVIIKEAGAPTPPAPNEELPEVTLEKITPALYKARIRFKDGKQSPFWLVFNESFNNGWRAYYRGEGGRKEAGGGGGGGVVRGVGDSMDDSMDGGIWPLILEDIRWIFMPGKRRDELKTHVMVNGFANGWWIEKGGSADGKGLTLTIEYLPQRALRGGVFISAVSGALFSSAVLLGAFASRRRKR